MEKYCQGRERKNSNQIWCKLFKNGDVETFEKFLEQNVESVRNFRITFSFFAEIFKLKNMI
jgi:hypothetical protein